ncbi:MOSC domain-containing protein, partial [Streptomyces sp. NPDC048508]
PCAQIHTFGMGHITLVGGGAVPGTVRFTAGIMSIVLPGGPVRPRDSVTVELPAGPHRPLEIV